MRRSLAIALTCTLIAVSACTASERSAESLALADSLSEISATVNGATDALLDLLAAEYDAHQQLYQRITDLRLPTTIAIELDKAQRIEPPPGSEGELDRYLDYLTELLLASEALDQAVANEDPVTVSVAAISMETSWGALAVALSGRTCAHVTPAPAHDLCALDGLDGYEADLSRELRRFVASFHPVFRLPTTFGNVVEGRVLSTLQTDAALVLDTTSKRMAELQPTASYERIHTILLEYFSATTTVWSGFDMDPKGSDPFLHGSVVDSLETERARAMARLADEYDLVQAALPDSPITAITGIWFEQGPETSE